MGVLKRGILGGFRGSVGPVTGTSWKGIDVMKSKPLSVANPRSPAQVAQRNKFAGVVALASALLVSIVKPLWDRFAQRESGYNAFVSRNISNFDANGDIIDFETIITSSGTWSNVMQTGAPTLSDFGLLTMNIAQNGGLASDEIFVTIINEATGVAYGATANGNRAVSPMVVDYLVDLTIGDQYRVYYATRRADGTAVSNSANVLVQVS
jgi:hypothetical protein